ncbi:MAG: hypothetical protein R6U17_01680 [Thermoplasmata archaeon]
MTMIELKREMEISRFYDPSKDELKEEKIVIRKDPLTGKRYKIVQKALPVSRDTDIREDVAPFF